MSFSRYLSKKRIRYSFRMIEEENKINLLKKGREKREKNNNQWLFDG